MTSKSTRGISSVSSKDQCASVRWVSTLRAPWRRHGLQIPTTAMWDASPKALTPAESGVTVIATAATKPVTSDRENRRPCWRTNAVPPGSRSEISSIINMGLLEFQSSPSAIAGRNGLSLMPPYQGFDSGLPRYSVVDTPEHDLSLRRPEAPHGGRVGQPRCSYGTVAERKVLVCHGSSGDI